MQVYAPPVDIHHQIEWTMEFQSFLNLLNRFELESPALFWLFQVVMSGGRKSPLRQKGATRLRGTVARGSTPVIPDGGLERTRSRCWIAHRPNEEPSR